MMNRSRVVAARLSARANTFNDRFPYVGPLIWILTIEYFIVQLIVASDWPAATPYSWSNHAISDLGNTRCGIYSHRMVCSPLHWLMNAAFVVLGAVMLAGAPLIYQEFRERTLTVIGFSCVAVGGLGSILVGLSPENVNFPVHATGAAGPFFIGNIGLIVLAFGLDLPTALRVITGVAGGLGLVGAVLFVTNAYLGLGEGGMERVAAYPQTLWLIAFGLYMTHSHRTEGRPWDRRKAEARRAAQATPARAA